MHHTVSFFLCPYGIVFKVVRKSSSDREEFFPQFSCGGHGIYHDHSKQGKDSDSEKKLALVYSKVPFWDLR